ALGGRTGVAQRLDEAAAYLPDGILESGQGEFFLAIEVVIQPAFPESRRCHDVRHRHAGITSLVEERSRLGHDGRAGGLGTVHEDNSCWRNRSVCWSMRWRVEGFREMRPDMNLVELSRYGSLG